jgi:surface polysaccharide O-acyltransferase-like enzyme
MHRKALDIAVHFLVFHFIQLISYPLVDVPLSGRLSVFFLNLLQILLVDLVLR